MRFVTNFNPNDFFLVGGSGELSHATQNLAKSSHHNTALINQISLFDVALVMTNTKCFNSFFNSFFSAVGMANRDMAQSPPPPLMQLCSSTIIGRCVERLFALIRGREGGAGGIIPQQYYPLPFPSL